MAYTLPTVNSATLNHFNGIFSIFPVQTCMGILQLSFIVKKMAILSKVSATPAPSNLSNFTTAVSNQIVPLVSKATGYASVALKTSKAVLDKYPPVKAFVYTLAGASAVPVAVFTGYAATSLGGVLAVAGLKFYPHCI